MLLYHNYLLLYYAEQNLNAFKPSYSCINNNHIITIQSHDKMFTTSNI